MLRKLLGHTLMEGEGGGEGGGGGGGGSGGGAGGGADFASLIPTEFREHPSLKDIKDMNGLVKSYVHAQSMVGADKVVIPKEGAKPEEIDTFYTKLGRPKTPAEYKFGEVKLPEGMKPADDAPIRAFAHKAGLNNQQADALNKFLTETAIGMMEGAKNEAAAQYKAAEEALRKDWGAEYDQNLVKARLAIKTFGGDELMQALDTLGLQDNPLLAKAFAKIGKALSEDQAFHQAGMREGFAQGADSAKLEIERLKTDREFQQAYMQFDHPGHKGAVDRMSRLYSTAYPTPAS